MFRVTIKAHGRLSRNSRVGREETGVPLAEGGRVRDLLAEVGILDSEVRRVTVNGRRGRLDQSLRRNDRVEVQA
jgi:sulfur carrier protein ThiS